jgi:AhpD family alkylhydroperoxidase
MIIMCNKCVLPHQAPAHVAGILAELDAANRTEAVGRARETGLLDH